MSDERPPQDFAEFLRRGFSSTQTAAKKPPRFKMSERNRRKMDRIRARVKELKNQ